MKKMFYLIVFLALLAGCTGALPEKMQISQAYSLKGVQTYSITCTQEGADLDPDLPKGFAPHFVQALESNLKMTLKRTNPEFVYTTDNPDMKVEVALEALHGGSAAARFWIGFGAGRSVSTVNVKVYKKSELIGEGRITEFTNMNWTNTNDNEDALFQDTPLLAKKVARFINDPVKYKAENEPSPAR